MFRRLSITAAVLILVASCSSKTTVCIYGGTSAAVTAAYSAAKQGSEVVLICPDVTIGGMTTGGLGQTDIGNKQAVTGLARQFYRRIGEHYGKLEQWIFEPHVAEEILMDYLDSPKIDLIQGYHLAEVTKDGTRILSIRCEDENGTSKTISADQFIDCSYEGDLMARAGVSYRVGREDNSEYSETWDGWQMLDGHQFPDGVDPYVIPGDPASGLLWGISENIPRQTGSGDSFAQAYNFRICLTDDPGNMIPIERPADYDSTRYELLVRLFATDPDQNEINRYFIWSPMPCHKTDINNRGAFSTDMIGMNHGYPEASWAERKDIIAAHKSYTLGLLYFYAHDTRVPAALQTEVRRWGLPKDEYVRTGHWTHQLYIRECRRLVGEYVATQADCENRTAVNDGIGYAAYTMDSHNCERLVVVKDGRAMVKNEGNVEIPGGSPYPISYRSLTPKREECTNLLVPVCLSASHIAYGSIRMEPVFLEMGQACGLAASMAGKGIVQEIDVEALQRILTEDPCLDGSSPDILIDEDSELIHGREGWTAGRGGSYGKSFLTYSGDPASNHLEYLFPEGLEGDYEIYTFQQKSGCRHTIFTIDAGKGPVQIEFDREAFKIEGQAWGEWVSLGKHHLEKEVRGTVKFFSEEPDLHADAVLLIRK